MTDRYEFWVSTGWSARVAPIDQMVVALGVHLHHRVLVTGDDALALLVGLHRRGFVEVACNGTAADGGADHCDALLVQGFASVGSLRRMVAACGAALRPEGGLGIALDEPASAREVRQLVGALRGLGYVGIHRKWSRDGAGSIVCARRRVDPGLRLAA